MTTPLETVKSLLSVTGDEWSDAEIQAMLDRHKTYVVSDPLSPLSAIPTAVWESDYRDWDSAVTTFADEDGAAIVPSDPNDPVMGTWGFEVAYKEVDITGTVYNVYWASRDLLLAKATKLAEDIQSFNGAIGSYTYAPKYKSYKNLADEYHARGADYAQAAATTIYMERVDTWLVE